MRTLAFDTATPATTVAVGDRDPRRAVTDSPAPGARPGHAQELLPLAAAVLRDVGWNWVDLERIVVGRGPGTFTGLRIGIATARGLAESLGIPLLGVSTLESLAFGAIREPAIDAEIVVGVLDARRREVFAAAWSRGQVPGPQLLEPAAVAPQALAEWIEKSGASVVAVGDGALAFREVLEAAGTIVPVDDSDVHVVSAANHLHIARDAPGGAPDAVEPDYLRIPDAELTRRANRPDDR